MAFSLTSEQQAAVDNRGGGLLVSAAAGSGKTRVLVERLLARVEGRGWTSTASWSLPTPRPPPPSCGAASWRSCPPGWRSAPPTPTCGGRPPWSIRPRSPPSTPSAPSFCGSAATCWSWTRTSACATRGGGHPHAPRPQRCAGPALGGHRRGERLRPAGGHHVRRAGRQPAHADRAGHPGAGAGPPQSRRLAGRAGAGLCPGRGRRPGETPWGRLLLDDAGRQGPTGGTRSPGPWSCAPATPIWTPITPPASPPPWRPWTPLWRGRGEGWDAAQAALPIPFPAAGRKKMVDCPDAAEQVKAIRAPAKADGEAGEWFEDCGADLLEDLRAVHPAVRGLFALVKDFEGAYAAEKDPPGHGGLRRSGAHGGAPAGGEDGAPTELARQWSARYDEIMVDEYQDTNEVQNAIFTALSREGRNLFLVGDVKQSIYRFRLADPTIFLGKSTAPLPTTPGRRRGRSGGSSCPGTSAPGRRCWRGQLCVPQRHVRRLRRDGLHRRRGPLPRRALPARRPLRRGAGRGGRLRRGEEEKTARDLIEARFAAKRIRALVDGGFPVSDGEGGERPVRPADIVILLPLPNTVLHHYARALGERGIPWEAEGGGDFFAATEVNVALSPAPDRGQPKAGRAPHLRPPLPGVRLLCRPAGGAPGRQSRHRLLRRPWPPTGEDSRAFLAELDELRFGAGS